MRPPVIKSSWKENRCSTHLDLLEATDLIEGGFGYLSNFFSHRNVRGAPLGCIVHNPGHWGKTRSIEFPRSRLVRIQPTGSIPNEIVGLNSWVHVRLSSGVTSASTPTDE